MYVANWPKAATFWVEDFELAIKGDLRNFVMLFSFGRYAPSLRNLGSRFKVPRMPLKRARKVHPLTSKKTL